jgi:hypothetical protein
MTGISFRSMLFALALALASLPKNALAQESGKAAIPTVSTSDMKEWIRQISAVTVGGSLSTETSGLLVLLEKMRLSLTSSSNIEEFRRNDDQNLISRLATIATADDAGLRFNSASILANVTDNTTLCVVLDKSLDRSIDIAARFNLLQTVKVVSTFSTRDNSYWIRSTINQIRSSSERKKDLDRTLQVLDQIDQSLDSQKDQFRASSLAVVAPAQFQQCIRLPSIAAFEADRKSYKVYVHTKRSPTDVAKLKLAVIGAGLNYVGDDSDEDPAGGLSVDFSTQGLRKKNQDAAQYVADTVNAYFPQSGAGGAALGLRARPQSAAPEKALGIWF